VTAGLEKSMRIRPRAKNAGAATMKRASALGLIAARTASG
jgi:hypothetical protein